MLISFHSTGWGLGSRDNLFHYLEAEFACKKPFQGDTITKKLSDDSELDLAKRKKLVGLSKRDRSNSAAKKTSNSNMLALVQEKLRHLEANYNLCEKEPEVTSPSSVLPNIAEYTNQHTVKYIRHPVYWNIEDIERHTDNVESNGDVWCEHARHDNARHDNAPEFQRLTSDDGLPIEMFGSVKSTICSVM